MSEEDRKRLTTLNGILPATFLVDGRVSGFWRIDKEVLTLSPFRRLTRSETGQVETEAERAYAFHRPAGQVELRWQQVS